MPNPFRVLKMDHSPPPPIHPLPLCKPLPLPLLSSINSKTHNCNNACRMVLLEMVHLPSTTLSIKLNRLYLRNDPGSEKIVWDQPLRDRIPAFCQRRAPKHLNRYHTKDFRAELMAPLNFKLLPHISTSSMPAPLPVYHRSYKTRLSLVKVGLRFKPHHRRLSRLPVRTLLLLPTPSMEAGSTLHKMEARRTHRACPRPCHKACHLVVALTQPSVPRKVQSIVGHLRYRTIQQLKILSGEECMTCV